MPVRKNVYILGRSPEEVRRMVYDMKLGKKARRPAKHWTGQEMAILRAHSNQEAWIVRAQPLLPGRTAAAIKLQAARLVLRFRNRPSRKTPPQPWSEGELSLLKKHQNASISELLELFPGCTKYAIEHRRLV